LTATITSPLSGAQFEAVANISITAAATDTDATVTKVEFYSGTQLIGTDTTAPYGCAWNNVGAGNYTLTAKATDGKGRSAVSSEVTVQIKRSTGAVGRAKKSAQTASNDLSTVAASSSVKESEFLLAQSSVEPKLDAVASDIQRAYDEFAVERYSYAAAGKIEVELQNALNYARSAVGFARDGNLQGAKGALRTAIDYLEYANVHMAHGDVPNPAVVTDFFVRQHYVDFLNREPDDSGLAFWTGEIAKCGNDARCAQAKRVHVSAAFFLSIEFQETGFLIHRLNRVSYGRMPSMSELQADAAEISQGLVVGATGWDKKLEANKAAFYQGWVRRRDFGAKYDGLTNAQYVDAIINSAGVTLSPEERQSWVATLDAGAGRDSVLRQAVERKEFVQRETVPAFVMMEYMGYLRRDADAGGYNFWLDKLNQFGGDYIGAEMVRAFIESTEYNQRFTNR
jgi:hypothetical protein